MFDMENEYIRIFRFLTDPLITKPLLFSTCIQWAIIKCYGHQIKRTILHMKCSTLAILAFGLARSNIFRGLPIFKKNGTLNAGDQAVKSLYIKVYETLIYFTVTIYVFCGVLFSFKTYAEWKICLTSCSIRAGCIFKRRRCVQKHDLNFFDTNWAKAFSRNICHWLQASKTVCLR